MLQELLKLYVAFMSTGVTSPMPHYVGPPGSGKSTVFQQAADLLGVKLHVINVSRLSPLELEGTEMPLEGVIKRNELFLARMWADLHEGDIVLFDEFLRGFPEVYNGLLDILTAREVAGHKLPKVFIAGASNTTVTYDSALEDRLLHIPVPDPRNKRSVRDNLIKIFVDEVGILGDQVHTELIELFDTEVLPMYSMIDTFIKKRSTAAASTSSGEGVSLRKLIGQVKLRHVTSLPLRELLDAANAAAMTNKLPQYVIIYDPSSVPANYEQRARELLESHSDKLTDLQQVNIMLNLNLIEAHAAALAE